MQSLYTLILDDVFLTEASKTNAWKWNLELCCVGFLKWKQPYGDAGQSCCVLLSRASLVIKRRYPVGDTIIVLLHIT